VHPLLFKGANKSYRVRDNLHHHRKAYNQTRTAAEQDSLLKKRLAQERKNLKKLQALGINYSFSPLVGVGEFSSLFLFLFAVWWFFADVRLLSCSCFGSITRDVFCFFFFF
jgi:hypothetical protein